MAKEVLGRLETALSRMEKLSATSSHSHSLYNADSMPVIPKDEPSEEKPFWCIPRADVKLTAQEVGKGKWGVVRVASYKAENVAARCFYNPMHQDESRKTFIESMDTAAKLRHPNILPLVGVILEREPVILTELMPTNLKKVLEAGSLQNYQIIKIALDVASALLFLHTTQPTAVLHGDLPSTKVLLQREAGNQWKAKIYNFMLVKYFRSIIISNQGSFDREGSMSPVPRDEFASPISRSSTPRVTPPPLGYRRKISGSDLSLNRRLSSRKQSQTAPDVVDMLNLTPQRMSTVLASSLLKCAQERNLWRCPCSFWWRASRGARCSQL